MDTVSEWVQCNRSQVWCVKFYLWCDPCHTLQIHSVFHSTLLKAYRENEIYRENFTPPELVDGEEVYEIETILNHRKRGQGYQYYVKWWGYPISDASWELEHAFSNDGNLLAKYKQRHYL